MIDQKKRQERNQAKEKVRRRMRVEIDQDNIKPAGWQTKHNVTGGSVLPRRISVLLSSGRDGRGAPLGTRSLRKIRNDSAASLDASASGSSSEGSKAWVRSLFLAII